MKHPTEDQIESLRVAHRAAFRAHNEAAVVAQVANHAGVEANLLRAKIQCELNVPAGYAIDLNDGKVKLATDIQPYTE